MFSQENYIKFLTFAANAHGTQKTPHDFPYLTHISCVAMEVIHACEKSSLDEKKADFAITCALLHDVIEDCPEITLDYLLQQGFPNDIVFAIECLTKKPSDQDYTEFIKQTERSALAVSVKLNDLRDNMDLTRFTRPLTDKDAKRLNKYLMAYLYLKEKY